MVRALGVERLREGKAQRAERRGPKERETGRVAHVVEGEVLQEDVAAVDEPREAQRRIVGRAGHRKQQLERTVRLAVAADRVAVEVLRSEGERAVAAQRAGTAGKEVLEEGQRLAAQAAGDAELAAGEQREVARERKVHLVLITETRVLQVAAGELGAGADEAARARGDQAVARVARPAGGDPA